MGVKVIIGLDEPDDALRDYGAGALIRLESAASEGGAYTELDTIAIIAATYAYEYFDDAGDATTWYRWRVSNTGNTEQSGYSAAFQGVDAAAESLPSASFATLEELLLTHRQKISDTRTLNRYEKVLRETTRDLIRELGGIDFFRHPQTGTTTRIYHGTGTDVLHVHEGIVALTKVEIRTETNGAWIELASDGWDLEGMLDDPNPGPGEPWFHVRLSPIATYTVFPKLRNGIRLTLAYGWPAVLADAAGANVAWARHRLGWDPSQPGGPQGPEGLQAGMSGDRMPMQVWQFLAAERGRHRAEYL